MRSIESVFINLTKKARIVIRVFLNIYQSTLLLKRKENASYKKYFHLSSRERESMHCNMCFFFEDLPIYIIIGERKENVSYKKHFL